MRHKVLTGIVVAVVILVVLGSGEENKANNSPVDSSSSSSSEKPLEYEVVKSLARGTTLTLRVYTTEKEDQRIIQVTDKLLSENAGLTHMFVEYFDDKEIASKYFETILSEAVTEEEKDQMFKHYIATFKYNTTTDHKILQKNKNGSWVELKKY